MSASSPRCIAKRARSPREAVVAARERARAHLPDPVHVHIGRGACAQLVEEVVGEPGRTPVARVRVPRPPGHHQAAAQAFALGVEGERQVEHRGVGRAFVRRGVIPAVDVPAEEDVGAFRLGTGDAGNGQPQLLPARVRRGGEHHIQRASGEQGAQLIGRATRDVGDGQVGPPVGS